MANPVATKKKRVFVIGAGMSKEVCAPLLKDFWTYISINVSKSDISKARSYVRGIRDNNIESILSRIDKNLFKGCLKGKYTAPELRAIRTEIVNAICEALTVIQYQFLHKHYAYLRHEDPYFYCARDFKALERVKKSFSQKPQEQLFMEMAQVRSRLKPSRTTGEMAYQDYETNLEVVLGENLDPSFKFYLYSAALAAGFHGFFKWLCHIWPLYLYLECKPFRVKDRKCDAKVKQECLRRLLRLLRDPTAACIKSINGWTRCELISLLSHWLTKGGISQNLLEEYALAIKKDALPVLARDRKWVKQQVKILLRSDINPYMLLAAFWNKDNAVISLNYDLFPEISAKTLHSDIFINYGIQGLTEIAPWGPIPFPYHETSPGHNFLNLLKPHGSINWIRCHDCGKLYCTPHMSANTSAFRYVLRNLAKFSLQQYGDYPCCFLFDPASVEIPIVPPTDKKMEGVGRIAEVWGEARKHIALADEVVFIGYALRKSDHDVLRLLKDAVAFRKSGKADLLADTLTAQQKDTSFQNRYGNKVRLNAKEGVASNVSRKLCEKPLKVVVVNPSKRDRKRYKRLLSNLGGVKLETKPYGASKYFKKEFNISLESGQVLDFK